MIRKLFAGFVMVAFVATTSGVAPLVAIAAQYTGVKDTMSSQAVSATSTHTITHTLVGGDTFAAAETFTYDFVDADFTLNAIGNWQTSDFTFNDGTSRTITAVSSSSGVAPTCTAGVNNVAVTINTSTNNFVVTACSTYTSSGSNAGITFTINGTTASGTGTMTNKNADLDSSLVSITGSNGDSASAAVVVETNSVVNITANVDPTLTFANDDAAIGFGTLTSGAARYANAAATGSGSSTVAHTMTIGTNAPTGYTLTYNGGLLTSGANTIAAATITGDADGTPGTAQFGIAAAVTGTGAAAAGYEQGSNNWNFVANTTSTLASASGTLSGTDSVAVRYLANIPTTQPAGSYSTSLTYIVTGNF